MTNNTKIKEGISENSSDNSIEQIKTQTETNRVQLILLQALNYWETWPICIVDGDSGKSKNRLSSGTV